METVVGKYGRFWGCTRYPSCLGRHGAHPNGEPMGIPADFPTREARIMAHAAFDGFWKKREMTRKEAYAWLGQELKLGPDDCHIGRFDLKTCKRVMSLCLRAALL